MVDHLVMCISFNPLPYFYCLIKRNNVVPSWNMSNNLHPCPYSCSKSLLSLGSGAKVDTSIPIWASSQPFCEILMKLIPNIPNSNQRPSMNESCPCLFFNGQWNCPFNNSEGFNCLFGPFFFLFFSLTFSNIIYCCLGHCF